MTDQSSPITPPPEELLDKWEGKWHHYQGQYTYEMFMAEQAAQWGADQELEACCGWLRSKDILEPAIDALRAARRPKPSLKERIAAAITEGDERTALLLLNEALPND